MQNTWGIFQGFNPITDPVHKWTIPSCTDCLADLIPWIDWESSGSIGYCDTCKDFYLVKSVWSPIAGYHPKLEMNELVRHQVYKIELDKISFLEVNRMWLCMWNEQVQAHVSEHDKILAYRQEFRGNKKEHALIQHLLWSVILNSDIDKQNLVTEYLYFVFKHPHPISIHGINIWLGHETDIARYLEQRYQAEMYNGIYQIWQGQKHVFTVGEFKSRIGFYVPLTDPVPGTFEAEFVDFCGKIRRRIIA